MSFGQPLQIEWHVQPLSEQGIVANNHNALIVNPLMKAQAILGTSDESFFRDSPRPNSTVQDFFEYLQRYLHKEINDRLRSVEPEINTVLEAASARHALLQEAHHELAARVHELRIELARAQPADEMDWEPSTEIQLTDWTRYLHQQVNEGTYTRVAPSFQSALPATPGGKRPDFQVPLGLSLQAHPAVRKNRSPRRRQRQESPAPRSEHSAPLGTPGQEPLTWAAAGAPGPSRPPFTQTTGTRGTEEPEIPQEPEIPDASGQQVGDAGGAGGNGGQGGRGGAGGPPSDPGSDESDSDPEPDREAPNRDWVLWGRRQRRKANMVSQIARLQARAPTAPQPLPQAPVPERAPDADRFDGTPEDLDLFLRQCRTKFRMEPRKFHTDLLKISYASLRLTGNAAKWYAQYCIKIDPEEQIRLGHMVEIDPQFATWDYFERSLRTSFGQRLNRESYVQEWNDLKHTNSIDDFVDNITRLMWQTGYQGAVVEDKIRTGLNKELGRDWAKVRPKPYHVAGQLQLLRDMGQRIEDYNRLSKRNSGATAGSSQKEEPSGKQGKPPGQKEKGKGKGKKGKGGPPAGKDNWKEKEVELKGVSKELRDARFKEDKCQKCGKGNHKWFECWAKEPVLGKVASSKKRGAPTEGTPAAKKSKGSTFEGELRVAGGRIVEYPRSPSMDIDIWEE